MRRYKKMELLEMASLLERTNDAIRKMNTAERLQMAETLQKCQQIAINIGNAVEEKGQAGTQIVSLLEVFCEDIYQMCMALDNDTECRKLIKKMQRILPEIKNRIRYDLPEERKEIVFLPYKASMWDSLESIYLAAREEENCDAYVVPIPYFDRNKDGSFGEMHYEGNEFPEDIPITSWEGYLIPERRPDAIYIHNPYDDCNYVTSVHPAFYSAELKKYTKCLVYVPYYATTGGMAAGQKLLPAYQNADYIVIQAPEYRKFFDEALPEEKFLPFGSPKFDRVIRVCQNPPQPPKEWAKKMTGKKVYFYNTSNDGMLRDTETFLKKMRYVFDVFKERPDICMLWRPHPLMESTFNTMRPQYKAAYDELKKYYLENEIGIFDTTPDITDTVALCDAYVGDAGTSVTSLFGIAGKPLFILDNRFCGTPDKDEWREKILPGCMFCFPEKDRYAIVQGNKLYISEPYAYDYKYFCDLSEKEDRNDYSIIREINGKRYVCPVNEQNILVLGEKGVESRIELEERLENPVRAFSGIIVYEKYLLLLPVRYPAIVRYDTESGEIRYFEEYRDIYVQKDEKGTEFRGGVCLYGNILYLASPIENELCKLNIESGEMESFSLQTKAKGGYIGLTERESMVWMYPYRGQTVLRWNLETGEVREYSGFPEGFQCIHPAEHTPTDKYPLGGKFFRGKDIYFVPSWGNMWLKLDTESGVFTEWEKPTIENETKDHFEPDERVVMRWYPEDGEKLQLFSWKRRKLYELDFEENTCREIEIKYDMEELKKHAKGFGRSLPSLRYFCLEDTFHWLVDFLDGKLGGEPFDKEAQINAYREIAANNDGSCGKKVHEFISSKLQNL